MVRPSQKELFLLATVFGSQQYERLILPSSTGDRNSIKPIHAATHNGSGYHIRGNTRPCSC